VAVVWKKIAFEDDIVLKALFAAHSVLVATLDNLPSPITIDASRILGRKAAGNISAMTPAEVLAILTGKAGAAFSFNGQVVDNIGVPVDAGDALRKGTRVTVSELPAMTDEKIWKGSGGNVEEVDMPAAGATLTVIAGVGTEVFNDTAPTVWTDLDLSGTIGSQATLVMLKIYSGAAAYRVCVRQDGDTDDSYSEGDGYSNAQRSDVATWGYFWVHTSAAGVIEWKTQSAQTMTIDVCAYIK